MVQRIVFASAFLVAFGLGYWVRGDGPPSQPAPIDEPLAAMNREFRAAYGLARAGILDRLGPVIIYDGENLILRRGKDRVQLPVDLTRYTRLKSTTHLPFAVFLLTYPAEGPLPEKRLANLERLLGRAETAQRSYANLGLTPEQLDRAMKIYDLSIQQIRNLLASKRCTPEENRQFARSVADLCLTQASDAARSQIDSMHAIVSQWRKELPAEEWNRLRVIVQGGQMPRKENITVQYFRKLMNLPGECDRLVYAESISEEPRCMSLLASHQLDTDSADAFFNDPTRLKRDLLCDAAAKYLETLAIP